MIKAVFRYPDLALEKLGSGYRASEIEREMSRWMANCLPDTWYVIERMVDDRKTHWVIVVEFEEHDSNQATMFKLAFANRNWLD